jgi:hypothetical protein
MLVVPAEIAVTIPVAASTEATAVLLLLQVPPASPLLLYASVAPIQSGELPLTVPELASGLTVKDADDEVGLPHPLFIV